MNILMIGDVFAKPGRQILQNVLPELKARYAADLTVVNGENAAGGNGVTRKVLHELKQAGADVITSGNHIWGQREILEFIDEEPYLIRPANYPEGAPGQGSCIIECNGVKVGVLNLAGRTFMPNMDCPFQKADALIKRLSDQCRLLLVDFHAEATSEKLALGYYLAGRVAALVGTHTHIQTADERILPEGTAYITDLGMTGPWDSVIGVDKDIIIKSFLSCRPVSFQPAKGQKVLGGVFIEVDDRTGKALRIERILEKRP